MPFCTIQSRKKQLALIRAACESRRPAEIAMREGGDWTYGLTSRLLQLRDDAVLLEWPGAMKRGAVPYGQSMKVAFEIGEHGYVFFASAYGRLFVEGLPAVLKLSLPLRVDTFEQRAEPRVALRPDHDVSARLTSVMDDQVIPGRVRDLSSSGLSVAVDGPIRRKLNSKEAFWAEFDLPGAGHFSFVVQLRHLQMVDESKKTLLGCSLHPADDDEITRDAVQRLRQFLAEYEPVNVPSEAPSGR